MAEGEGGTTPTGAVKRFIDIIDHPLVFGIAIVFLVIPIMALLTTLFKFLGWPGPASLVQTP